MYMYVPWDGNRQLAQGGQEILVVGWREKMSFLLAPSSLKGKTINVTKYTLERSTHHFKCYVYVLQWVCTCW